ncbi:hypothetical protein AAG906_026515 [Vitis piasezkii]
MPKLCDDGGYVIDCAGNSFLACQPPHVRRPPGRPRQSKEQDFEAPSSYDTYDEQSLARMKFEKGPDGSWNRKVERPAPQPAVEEEAEIGEMEGGMPSEAMHTAGTSAQPSSIDPPHAHTSPHEAPYRLISSLGARIEELAIVKDMRFHSMEDRMDHYQTGFTEQFQSMQQRFQSIEDRMDQKQATFAHILRGLIAGTNKHEDMMAYIRSVFPPAPPKP